MRVLKFLFRGSMRFPSSWGGKFPFSWLPALGTLVGVLILVVWGLASQLVWFDLGVQVRRVLPRIASPWVVTVVLESKDANPESQSRLLKSLHSAGVRTVLWTTVYSQGPQGFFAQPFPNFQGGLIFPTPRNGALPAFEVSPDPDGRIRHVTLTHNDREKTLPTAPLQALQNYLAIAGTAAVRRPQELFFPHARFPGGFMKAWGIPLDSEDSVWFGFSGDTWTKSRYYLSSVILRATPRTDEWANLVSELRDTLVLVTEPAGELSQGQTPFEQELPLVELNRIFLSESLSGTLSRPWQNPVWVVVLSLSVLTLVCFWKPFAVGSAAAVASVSLLVWFWGVWEYQLFDPSPWLTWSAGVGCTLIVVRNLESRKSHRQLHEQWMREQVWARVGKQTSQLSHNLKGLTSLVLQLTLQIRRRTGSEPVDRWTELQESGLRTIQALLTESSGFLQGEHWKEGDPVQLKPLIQGLWNLYEGSWPQLGTLDLPGTSVLAAVHPAEFLQVVDNLIKNSIEAVPAGMPPRLRISLAEDEEGISFALDDNGVGFQDKTPRLGWTSKPEGTGTGLTFLDSATKRWGARWRIEPLPEGGSRVSIASIPRWKA